MTDERLSADKGKRFKHLPADRLRVAYDGTLNDPTGIFAITDESATWMRSYLMPVVNGTVAKHEQLYHYTTIEGFRSIVDSGDLWISSFVSMNDFDEIETAFKELELICLRKLDPIYREKAEWRGIFDEIRKEFQCFILSLTKNPDSLAMYRSYASPIGVAIGFPIPLFLNGLDGRWSIGDVLYNKEEHTKVLNPLACDICDLIANPVDEKTRQSRLEKIKTYLSNNAPFIKNFGFHEEREVRLVTDGNLMKKYIRRRGDEDIEYIKLSWLNCLVQADEADCAFESVHISPGIRVIDRLKEAAKILDDRERRYKGIFETGISARL